MAPEMLLDQGYDEKADVYSFGNNFLWFVVRFTGIVLWELLTEEEPYKGKFNSFQGIAT
jgi:serine/threonine protein kinase